MNNYEYFKDIELVSGITEWVSVDSDYQEIGSADYSGNQDLTWMGSINGSYIPEWQDAFTTQHAPNHIDSLGSGVNNDNNNQSSNNNEASMESQASWCHKVIRFINIHKFELALGITAAGITFMILALSNTTISNNRIESHSNCIQDCPNSINLNVNMFPIFIGGK